MTAKIDGTNGVLQSYDYQTPSTGFSYTFAAGTQMLFMVPASTLASGTITMPSAPADGMMITFSSSQQITALTLQGNSGQSISGAVTFLPAQTAASYVYRLANATWYPCETVPGTGSQLVLGTSQSATSGTSKDFTGIPSWVKRITVMIAGVSTTGTSEVQIQLGTSGGVTSSGYVGVGDELVSGGNSGVTAFTSGLVLGRGVVPAASTRQGIATFVNVTGNQWVATYLGGVSGTVGDVFASTLVTLSGALTQVRITTVNGTDAFDAGSVNIMYE